MEGGRASDRARCVIYIYLQLRVTEKNLYEEYAQEFGQDRDIFVMLLSAVSRGPSRQC